MTNSGFAKIAETQAAMLTLHKEGYGPSSKDKPELRALLDSWYVAQKDLAETQARERALREQLIEAAFGASQDRADFKGTKRAPLDFGMELVANFRINHKIDKETLVTALNNGNSDERSILQRVFRFEPKVNEKEYNQLSHNELGYISQFVTDSPGLPSLEIKKAK